MKRYGRRVYNHSYACPSTIGQRKEYVEIFDSNLKPLMGNFEMVYTRNEKGRAEILRCRRRSYIA